MKCVLESPLVVESEGVWETIVADCPLFFVIQEIVRDNFIDELPFLKIKDDCDDRL